VNKKAFKADILLLITAAIWGFGFVAQSAGMDYVGPFTYNAIRFFLGSLSLLPLIFFQRSRGALSLPAGTPAASHARMAFLAGTVLFVAVAFQQLGIIFTTVGNAGFITGFYVVLTPVFGIFLGKKTGVPTWIGMVIALIGLYLIFTPKDMAAVNPGDLITVISAVFWACHILIIDRLVQKTDALILSCGQFAVCGAYMLIAAVAVEPFVMDWARSVAPGITLQPWIPLAELCRSPDAGTILLGAAPSILYGGLCSVGIAYTLQVVAQKDAPPAHATIILCLEGSFAALGGALLRGEKPGGYTLLGFAFMLAAMFITQWDVIFGAKKINRGR